DEWIIFSMNKQDRRGNGSRWAPGLPANRPIRTRNQWIAIPYLKKQAPTEDHQARHGGKKWAYQASKAGPLCRLLGENLENEQVNHFVQACIGTIGNYPRDSRMRWQEQRNGSSHRKPMDIDL